MKIHTLLLVPVSLLIIGLITSYTKNLTVMVISHALWFIAVVALMLWFYLFFTKQQNYLVNQVTNLLEEEPAPPQPLPYDVPGGKKLEDSLVMLAEKIKEYKANLWRQTARQAGGALKLMFDSTIDGLTGIPNRKCLSTRLSEHMEGIGPVSVIMMDIDFFKKVNDTYGHQAGDEVLQQFAKILTKTVRPDDFVARYGGEEFTVICLSDANNTYRVAERIRVAVENTPMKTCAGLINITSSLGVAERLPKDTQETLLKRADDYLYQAKKNGRNQVKGDVGIAYD